MLVKAHDLLYSRLSQDDRVSEAGLVIVPGQLRQQDVAVQRHQPPIAHAVPNFLRAADDAYAKPWALESFLVAAACQHHRMLWVHPFGFPLDALSMLFPRLYPEAGAVVLD